MPAAADWGPMCEIAKRCLFLPNENSFVVVCVGSQMIALIAGMGDSRGLITRQKERRKELMEYLFNFRKSLDESPEFKQELLQHGDRADHGLDCRELRELIQKYGQIPASFSRSKSADGAVRSPSNSRYRAMSPSEDELAFILSAASRLKRNEIVPCHIRFSLVCTTCKFQQLTLVVPEKNSRLSEIARRSFGSFSSIAGRISKRP